MGAGIRTIDVSWYSIIIGIKIWMGSVRIKVHQLLSQHKNGRGKGASIAYSYINEVITHAEADVELR